MAPSEDDVPAELREAEECCKLSDEIELDDDEDGDDALDDLLASQALRRLWSRRAIVGIG